ncbi:MAG TPA: hypothetical protein VF992_07900 [Thermoplasmata archaeon]
MRTEVEVITFHRAGDAKSAQGVEDAAIAVGGLVYGMEAGRWVYRGIKETYLKSRLKQGETGVGQVLAIGEPDAKVIQRDLHASLGLRTYRITEVCSGSVARKLRGYLKTIGNIGLKPLHPLDIGRQANTRGWVMQRNEYSSLSQLRAAPAVQIVRPERSHSPLPVRRPTSRGASSAVGNVRTVPFTEGTMISSTHEERWQATSRDVGSAAVKAFRALVARGRTIIGGALRRRPKRATASTPGTVALKVTPDPATPGEGVPSVTLPAIVVAKPKVRPVPLATVRMRLRPLSRPPARKGKRSGIAQGGGSDARIERKGEP